MDVTLDTPRLRLRPPQLGDAARTEMVPWMSQMATVDALLDPGSWARGPGLGTSIEPAVAAAIVGRRDLAVQRLHEAILSIDDDERFA